MRGAVQGVCTKMVSGLRKAPQKVLPWLRDLPGRDEQQVKERELCVRGLGLSSRCRGGVGTSNTSAYISGAGP